MMRRCGNEARTVAKVISFVPVKQQARLLGGLPGFLRPAAEQLGVGVDLQADYLYQVLYTLGIPVLGVSII
jgi:hypothetical protein